MMLEKVVQDWNDHSFLPVFLNCSSSRTIKYNLCQNKKVRVFTDAPEGLS